MALCLMLAFWVESAGGKGGGCLEWEAALRCSQMVYVFVNEKGAGGPSH